MVKTLFNIGIINDQTNFVKLAIELGIFILIVVILAVFIYKKTKRSKTVQRSENVQKKIHTDQ